MLEVNKRVLLLSTTIIQTDDELVHFTGCGKERHFLICQAVTENTRRYTCLFSIESGPRNDGIVEAEFGCFFARVIAEQTEQVAF